jgi:hypothetical protein
LYFFFYLDDKKKLPGSACYIFNPALMPTVKDDQPATLRFLVADFDLTQAIVGTSRSALSFQDYPESLPSLFPWLIVTLLSYHWQ